MARAQALRYASLAFPSGTRLWGSVSGELAGFGSGGGAIPAGFYEPKVKAWGAASIGGWPEGGGFSLRVPELTLTIEDFAGEASDGSFARLVGSGEDILCAPATVGAYFPETGISKTFAGIISRREQTSASEWNVGVRANDGPYNITVPKITIRKADWPKADPAIWGSSAPLIYGTNDSSGISDDGAIQCLYVDKIGYRYLVAYGWVNVLRVFKDGARVTANFAITHVLMGGAMWTCIDFTGSQGTSTITADVQGYESVGDGTGTFLSKPGQQLEHYLRNFVFGTPIRGVWRQSDTVPLLSSTFTLASLDARAGGHGYLGGRYINSPSTPAAEIAAWCESWGVYPFLDEAGNLGMMLDDPQLNATTWCVSGSSTWLRKSKGDFESLKQVLPNSPLRRRAAAALAFAANGASDPFYVTNPLSKSLNEESSAMAWGPAYG